MTDATPGSQGEVDPLRPVVAHGQRRAAESRARRAIAGYLASMRLLAPIALCLASASCGTPDCTLEQCGDWCPSGDEEPAVALTEFEAELMAPILADLRAGVGPFGDDGFGICRGAGTCEEFLGADAGELEPGAYMLRALVRVPPAGEWSLRVRTQCEVTGARRGAPDEVTTEEFDRTYTLRYPGPERGYPLQPVLSLDSPRERGSAECFWEFTAPGPDREQRWEGSWSVGPGEGLTEADATAPGEP